MAPGWNTVRSRDRGGLTPRERQCVRMEQHKCSRLTIAQRLGLAVATVAVHLWKASQRGARLAKPLRRKHWWTARERRGGDAE